ncbi:hypothetical protein RNI52_08805 [Labrys neptuniae]|uniref:hypothetical protein n=1 Tax=Labrys neptuniae TaxID=376174 RepID=UPI0028925D01|nr:hypothetical protein [Labrys neptuniae]MDT3377418.1 hypothetical protein [Labrys neptuniae]
MTYQSKPASKAERGIDQHRHGGEAGPAGKGAEAVEGDRNPLAGNDPRASTAAPAKAGNWHRFKLQREADEAPEWKPKLGPEIKYIPSELPLMVDLACKAALKAGVAVYARGTSLVRPVVIPSAEMSGHMKRPEGATILVTVDKAALVEILTETADWRRAPSKEGKEWTPIPCPKVVAETTISRRGKWPFPQLRGVISAPTMRPDGSIMNAPGFDPKTGILFASELKWPQVPERPTMAVARTELERLKDLVRTFPFVDDADRSAALAMILTALIRPCLPSAPMFGVSAPTPGTGKSKLVDVASILATGRAASVMSVPGEEDELKKQVGSALMAGDSFLTLDNVEHPLRSAFLCQVLTQGSVEVRVLGESRKETLPTGSTFCATGNSLRFAGDLVRRVVLINLDAGRERPEDRVFKTDVVDEARNGRGQLVAAALTVLRAFVVRHGEKIVPALGGFERWSDLVRSALVWLGEADPLGNASKVRDNDPEREKISLIMAALPMGRSWTAAEICTNAAEEGSALNAALAAGNFTGRNGRFDAVGLGNYLRKHKGRIIDGKRIIDAGRNRNKITSWRVEDLSAPEADDDVLW